MKKSHKPLSEQVVVITGASSGIGLSTARLAAKQGAKVFLAARDDAALASICDELRASGAAAHYLAMDVGSEADIGELAREATALLGGFDTWVNVAGVGIIANLADTVTADHRRLFDTNYWGVVYGSLAAARHFREQGKAGTIINVGSAFSDLAVPTMGAYAASKFAVKAFTNSLRVELAHEGLPVRVTLVKPSVVDSMFYDHAQTPLDTAAWIPPPRYAPSVVAEAILDAAVHTRRELAIGAPAVFAATGGVLFPALMERTMRFMGTSIWRDPGAPRALESGVRGRPAEGHERSGREPALGSSLTATVQRHPLASLAVLLGAGLALGALTRRAR